MCGLKGNFNRRHCMGNKSQKVESSFPLIVSNHSSGRSSGLLNGFSTIYVHYTQYPPRVST